MGEMLSDNWASLEICLLDGEVESIDKLYLSLEMDGVVSMIQLLLKNALHTQHLREKEDESYMLYE